MFHNFEYFKYILFWSVNATFFETKIKITSKAYVDVVHQTMIGIRLFDWDRTGEADPLGRFDTNKSNLFKKN